MSELELPQLQIGRYVDLLKRRKWQLVPAALLGLGAGLLVASMIPRYYEAETVARIYPRPGTTPSAREDPFLQEISKAKNTVRNPRIIEAAVRKLGWNVPFDSDDDDAFHAYIMEIRDRVSVLRYNAGIAGASSALLSIKYRDLDGKRAADMANEIREVFIEREREGVLDRERVHLAKLVTDVSKRGQAYSSALDDQGEWLAKFGVNPLALDESGQPVALVQEKEAQTLRTELEDLRVAIDAAKAQLAALVERRDALDEWHEKDPVTDPELVAQLGEIDAAIQARDRRLADWKPTHPQYAATRKEREQLVGLRKRFLAKLAKEGKLRERNPDWVAANRRIEQLEVEISGLETKREGKGRRLRTLAAFLAKMPAAFTHLAKLKQKVDAAKEAFETADGERARQESLVAFLELNQKGIVDVYSDAWQPTEPTYPNKLLVALLGAAIGLAVAIGVIFVYDVLQATYKSFDEVARGLPVPALGGMSFLDLPEEVRAAKLRRLKTTLAVVLVLAIVGAVFALYFLDPVRLPAWLRDLFDRVFADGG